MANVKRNGAVELETPNGKAQHANRAAGHLAAMESKPAPKNTMEISLPQLDIRTLKVDLVGVSELVVHAWSEKAIKEMLDKQMGKATAGREKKDPVADFLGSLYTIQPGQVVGKFDINDLDECGHPKVYLKGGRFGFPAIAFKSAAVEACTSLGRSNITKVQARQCFHVVGELVEIVSLGKPPRMRMDMVRLSGSANPPPDIRFRAGFRDWSVSLTVRYNARVLSAEQVVNVFNTAGFGVGVGEWRSEKDGGFGLFEVKRGA